MFPHRVTYHPTCHGLRMLGLGERPLKLLRAVRDIDLVELPRAEQCCGFGGTFAVKNADTSVAMLTDKLASVKATGAEVCVAADTSCLMHIGGGLRRQRAGVRTLHLAEVLASTMSFADAARVTLADTQLRRNLGKATTAIRAKRAGVVGEVADWEALRDAGAAIKDRALLRPAGAARAPGGVGRPPRAASSTGRATARRPTRSSPGSRATTTRDEVVKVKSIATDEIGLNEALAAAGIEAIETDLAELIIQLGDDVQSHILVPAIHRNREEIRALFARTIADDSLTSEPAELAEAARKHLRAAFLRAKVGVSRRELRGGGDGHGVRRRVGGQRPHVHRRCRRCSSRSWASRR